MPDRLQDISHVVSAQIFSRLVTFVMNVGIARVASPEDYGVGFVSFQLFLNLALFFPKECFRKVALRANEGQEAGSQLQSSMNVCWFGVVVALFGSAGLAIYWSSGADHHLAVVVLALAAMIESFGEPFLVAVLLRSDFKSRAAGEGVAILARTMFMFLFVAGNGRVPLAFAFGSMLYSVIWVAWFARDCSKSSEINLLPARLPDGCLFLSAHREILWSFAGHTALKLILTEGEKLMLLAAFEEKAWGVFGLVSNLGSIVLRLLFAPIEEIAYAAFGQGKGNAREHWPLLRSLLFFQGSVGWLGLCFGPGFSAVVVRVLYGTAWAGSDAPQVLSVYCGLLFAMALNGVLEAFMFAAASPKWLRLTQAWNICTSLVFVTVAWLLKTQGPSALVVANLVAMSLRISICLVFVRSELQVGLKDLDAPIKFLALVAFGGVTCSLTVPKLGSPTEPVPWLHVIVSVGLAVVVIGAIVGLCRRELWSLVAAARGARAHNE